MLLLTLEIWLWWFLKLLNLNFQSWGSVLQYFNSLFLKSVLLYKNMSGYLTIKNSTAHKTWEIRFVLWLETRARSEGKKPTLLKKGLWCRPESWSILKLNLKVLLKWNEEHDTLYQKFSEMYNFSWQHRKCSKKYDGDSPEFMNSSDLVSILIDEIKITSLLVLLSPKIWWSRSDLH